ncbi:EthD domain-containing protein [Amycolatopsis pithecellobii]|uniref:EthD family reductase n=1 Tax=Amycolatopsis pithecellobii TaxID=664692 RepID=A0A6N7Z651_9PSEU|nr:EthD domain-containing protein [Amycolatopsis pithecellobii]MTD54976.1 EthD family reductase [Amycolatopsis pithecellobii]
MVKVVVICKRKPGVSLGEFNEHWRTTHARLVTRLATTLNVGRYVQSYRGGSEAIARFVEERGWSNGDYDAITELWFDSAESLAAAFSSPEGLAALKELHEDEARIVDMPSVLAWVTEENVVLDKTKGA